MSRSLELAVGSVSAGTMVSYEDGAEAIPNQGPVAGGSKICSHNQQ